MPRTNLTQAFIDKHLMCPAGKKAIEFNDTQITGFYVEVSAASPGKGTYRHSYKDGAGKRRHIRIGRTTEISLKDARTKALELKAQVRTGKDPAADIRAIKDIPTIKAFLEEQYLPHSKRTKRSYVTDESICRLRLIPRFGDLRMDKLTRKMLADFLHALVDEGLAPASANHYIKLMRAAYNKAIEWEVVTTNPAAGLTLLREDNEVNNYLNDEQLGRLLTVLRTDSNRAVCNLCLFLLATGARKTETLHARWEHIDEENRVWRIPAANAKSRKVRSVPLNDTALGVLADLRGRAKGEWLFLGQKGEPLRNVNKVWLRIRAAAGVSNLRLHDLRHQAASLLINSGRSLFEVQAQLGHSDHKVTQRYAHLSTATMQEAANSIDTALAKAEAKAAAG